jgi:uncharacterized protein YjiS (DUF1127 family)
MITDRNTATAILSTLVRTVAGAARAAAARRAQRIALGELMQMDSTRLDDLGLNHQDVIEALSARKPPAPSLADRRDARIAAGLKPLAA